MSRRGAIRRVQANFLSKFSADSLRQREDYRINNLHVKKACFLDDGFVI